MGLAVGDDAVAAEALAGMAGEHELVVTHGNGPQVGLLALQVEAYPEGGSYPLDVLGAESEGMIGYLLAQGLRNALGAREIATLLTQVVVDPADPAFTTPSKPIGPVYDTDVGPQRGWTMRPDGSHWRRVVASPEPRSIVELPTIRRLVEAGVLVICTGGGGVPVVAGEGGALTGVEAVVDKDLAAALLAEQLDADALLLLTDVPSVMLDWGTDRERPLRRATPEELAALGLAAGSMGPKARAASRFAEATGGLAAIGALQDATALLSGARGTLVEPAAVPA
jgi:carbamate kinase